MNNNRLPELIEQLLDRETWTFTRDEIATELSFHSTSNTHPEHCLCGMWDGSGDFAEHVSTHVLMLLGYSEPASP